MTEQEILNWMQLQRSRHDVVLLSARDIAEAAGITVYQARECLENLSGAGIIDRIPASRGVPVLWFLL